MLSDPYLKQPSRERTPAILASDSTNRSRNENSSSSDPCAAPTCGSIGRVLSKLICVKRIELRSDVIKLDMQFKKKLDYQVVDVFTTTAFKGNPLAVVFDTVGLSTERMQTIAREFNLSETTFIQRADPTVERSEGVRVRIFTSQEELNFAGHPTLGTASVLRSTAPDCAEADTVKLKLNVGVVPVTFSLAASCGDALHGEMVQRDPEFGDELDLDTVARLCSLSLDDLDPALAPQVVSTGTAFAIVPVRSLEALGRLKVDHDRATPWLREHGGRWFYVLAPTLTQDEMGAKLYRARMQFNSSEDPATGSAAGCAICYLVDHGAVASDQRVLVLQGVEIGRTSEIHLAAKMVDGKVGNVRVGGSTVPVANGAIFLP
jgi:trans-2,3-dihydro-3-hydroxyanthranilate isomerase